MIPQVSPALQQDFTVAVQPTGTFRLNPETQTLTGRTDGIQALEQAIFLILSTERYRWLIHSWNYGVELHSLIGKDIEYCIPEVERRIREALLQDDRIQGVENFSFDLPAKGKLHAAFTVETVYGGIRAEKEVDY